MSIPGGAGYVFPADALAGWDKEFSWEDDILPLTVSGIIEYADNADRARLAHHRSVGARGLRRLFNLGIADVSLAVASSPYLTGRSLPYDVAVSSNPDIRVALIMNPAVDVEIIRSLKRDKVAYVRQAQHRRLTRTQPAMLTATAGQVS